MQAEQAGIYACRESAKAVGTEAARMKEELQATLVQKDDLALQASKLAQVCHSSQSAPAILQP